MARRQEIWGLEVACTEVLASESRRHRMWVHVGVDVSHRRQVVSALERPDLRCDHLARLGFGEARVVVSVAVEVDEVVFLLLDEGRLRWTRRSG